MASVGAAFRASTRVSAAPTGRKPPVNLSAAARGNSHVPQPLLLRDPQLPPNSVNMQHEMPDQPRTRHSTTRMDRGRRNLTLAVGILPHSRVKLWLLRRLLGWSVASDCIVGPCIFADIGRVSLDSGTRIRGGNVWRNLQSIRLGKNVLIGSWNWITAAPEFFGDPGFGELVIEDEGALTSSHYLDCSATIRIGRCSTIGGRGSTLITHQVEYVSNTVRADPITVGDRCLVNSNVRITPGCRIADGVLVAMGAVIAGDLDRELTLYAGVPAVAKKQLDGEHFHRTVGRVEAEAAVG